MFSLTPLTQKRQGYQTEQLPTVSPHHHPPFPDFFSLFFPLHLSRPVQQFLHVDCGPLNERKKSSRVINFNTTVYQTRRENYFLNSLSQTYENSYVFCPVWNCCTDCTPPPPASIIYFISLIFLSPLGFLTFCCLFDNIAAPWACLSCVWILNTLQISSYRNNYL